jgi:hypothetical protein
MLSDFGPWRPLTLAFTHSTKKPPPTSKILKKNTKRRRRKSQNNAREMAKTTISGPPSIFRRSAVDPPPRSSYVLSVDSAIFLVSSVAMFLFPESSNDLFFVPFIYESPVLEYRCGFLYYEP